MKITLSIFTKQRFTKGKICMYVSTTCLPLSQFAVVTKTPIHHQLNKRVSTPLQPSWCGRSWVFSKSCKADNDSDLWLR